MFGSAEEFPLRSTGRCNTGWCRNPRRMVFGWVYALRNRAHSSAMSAAAQLPTSVGSRETTRTSSEVSGKWRPLCSCPLGTRGQGAPRGSDIASASAYVGSAIGGEGCAWTSTPRARYSKSVLPNKSTSNFKFGAWPLPSCARNISRIIAAASDAVIFVGCAIRYICAFPARHARSVPIAVPILAHARAAMH